MINDFDLAEKILKAIDKAKPVSREGYFSNGKIETIAELLCQYRYDIAEEVANAVAKTISTRFAQDTTDRKLFIRSFRDGRSHD